MRRATLMLLPLALLGCHNSQGSQSEVLVIPPPAAPHAGSAPAAPAPAAHGAESAATGVMQGTVLERLDAAPYSYLRLKTAQGERWVAVPQTEVKNGTGVKVVNAFQMDHFESKKLNRTFDSVWLGNLEGQAGAASAAMPPHGDMAKPAADVGKVQVDKATGAEARSVAEVFAQREALGGKAVVVRGKVVKFLPEIMGKNWVHLRDGSGSDAGKDNDLAVTTKEMLKAGDVVTVRGVIGRKRDFGAGYFYDVILEDAKVQK